MFHRQFLLFNQKKSSLFDSIYILNLKAFSSKAIFSGFAHEFLGMTVMKVNHSIQQEKKLDKKKESFGIK